VARILIVDDEEMERVLLTALLEQEGHELSYAKDVEDGLRPLPLRIP
jgi:DNA-binding response OmpR family regulator